MERRGLKVLRARHGLTQGQMAERIGMSRSNYCQIENGRQSAGEDFAKRLQSAFGIPDGEMWALLKQEGKEG